MVRCKKNVSTSTKRNIHLLDRKSTRTNNSHISLAQSLPSVVPYTTLCRSHARREKPFRWGFSPVTPSSATTQRGAPAPLWIPPPALYLSCCSTDTPDGAL